MIVITPTERSLNVTIGHTETVVVSLESDAAADAVNLFQAVWTAKPIAMRAILGRKAGKVVSPAALQKLVDEGDYAAGAYRAGALVGCAVGKIGADPDLPREALRPNDCLHSFIVGVAPSTQGQGIGFALKKHQREWALERDIKVIRWTFDPLVRRNAHFNISKLGAEVIGYLPNCFGKDGASAGGVTDRLLVEWSLDSPAVEAAMTRDSQDTADPWPTAGEIARGLPDAKRIRVPKDIQSTWRRAPCWARWKRFTVRRRFQDLFGREYRVVGFTRDGNYVLLPPDQGQSALR